MLKVIFSTFLDADQVLQIVPKELNIDIFQKCTQYFT